MRKRPRKEEPAKGNRWRLLLGVFASLAASQNNVQGFVYPIEKNIRSQSPNYHHMDSLLFAQAPHRRRPPVPSNAKRATKTTTTTLNKKDKAPQPRRKRKRKRVTFSVMFERLKQYYQNQGHCLVSSEDEDAELYKWTRSIRKNYKHQFTEQVRPRKTHQKSSNHKTRRPMLSESKAKMLQSVNFCWNVQEAVWQQKCQQLADFYDTYGHDAPVHAEDPALAVWLSNQRRDYRQWLQDLPNNLTPERLEALEELGVFEDYKTQRQAWTQHYQYLVEFHQQYGHVNVPQQYQHPVTIQVMDDTHHEIHERHLTFALGRWCMNQRTARKRWDVLQQQQQQQEDEQDKGRKKSQQTTAKSKSKNKKKSKSSETTMITAERIRLLDALDFSWNVRESKWQGLLKRLQAYYQTHGHLKIPVTDVANQDLRQWLRIQRHFYHRQQGDQQQSSSMTPLRIASMEQAIPDFSWKAYNKDGPSTEDWSNLFQAMRAKGIAPEARAKEHWFEGQHPFQMEVKSQWTEQELVALWHQDDEEEEDDNEEGDPAVEDPTMLANGSGSGINYYVDLEDNGDKNPDSSVSDVKKQKPSNGKSMINYKYLVDLMDDDEDEDDDEHDIIPGSLGSELKQKASTGRLP